MGVSRRSVLAGTILVFSGCTSVPRGRETLLHLVNHRDSAVEGQLRLSERQVPDDPAEVFSTQFTLDPEESVGFTSEQFPPGEYLIHVFTSDGLEDKNEVECSTDTPGYITINEGEIEISFYHED